ncbi:MAG: DUF1538 domain-containing protein [Bacteroidota bacterium]
MISLFFRGFTHIIRDVALALSPVVVLFLLAQVFILRLPKKQITRIIKGVLIAFLGLVLFLQGVTTGYMPAGQLAGKVLGGLEHNWILIPVGFLIGFMVILAEPAVLVLNDQIEKVSGGYINKKIMTFTLCIGVAVAVALSMWRVLAGISLWFFILPGYAIAFLLSRFSKPDFTAIAFDSGGVATGPMTVTFILSMTVGVATQLEGRDPLMDGFGTVSLVALTPILAVLILGFIYSRKEDMSE